MVRRRHDHAQAEALLHHVVAQLTREAVTSEQKKSELHEQRHRARLRASRLIIGITIPLLVALTALNVAIGGAPGSWQATAGSDREARHTALNFVVEEVESYRYEHDRLPSSLNLLDVPEFGEWHYERQDETDYVVELTDAGTSLRFDSRDDADGFRVRGGGAE